MLHTPAATATSQQLEFTRCISWGSIFCQHFGHVVCSDVFTLSRFTRRFGGIAAGILHNSPVVRQYLRARLHSSQASFPDLGERATVTLAGTATARGQVSERS